MNLNETFLNSREFNSTIIDYMNFNEWIRAIVIIGVLGLVIAFLLCLAWAYND